MRRALWFIVKLAVVIAIAVFLADRPGTVEVAWSGRIIEMQIGVLLLLVFLLMVAAAVIFWLYRNAARAPKSVRQARASARRAKGYRALTDGLVSVAAGDSSGAQRYAKKADVLLNEPPLTMLLSAQAAQLDGDEQAAEHYFRAMLDREETRFLGLRGLITQAIKRGDRTEALSLARQARDMRPDTRWALESCFELEVAAADWPAAQHSLNLAVKGKAIDKRIGSEHRAAVLLARAEDEARAGNATEARDRLREVVGLRRDWVPAVLVLARLQIAAGKQRAAQRAIESAWVRQPHPDLVVAYDDATRQGGKDDTDERMENDAMVRLRRREALFKLTPDHPESLLIQADSEMAAGLWGAARSHLRRVVDQRPTRRAYHLLADLELAEKGDAQASRDWLAKAETAPPDSAWACGQCGSTHDAWHAICGMCGAFDAISWRDHPDAPRLTGGPADLSIAAPSARLPADSPSAPG